MSQATAMLFAKALYANHADTDEELSFVAGDVLTVVERDVAGLVGWWLCSLAGRIGIAPGNRLRLLADADSPVKATAPGRQAVGFDGSTTAGRGRTAAVDRNNTMNAAATEGSTLKVPHKSGNVYIYDNIQNIQHQQQQQQQQQPSPIADYDFPTPHYAAVASSSSAGSSNCSSPNSSTPPVRAGGSGLVSPPRRDVIVRSTVTSVVSGGSQDGDYDVPVPFDPQQQQQQQQDCSPTSVVSSNRSSLVSIQSGASSSSVRSCQSAATGGSEITRVVGRRQQHLQQTPADGTRSARSSDGHDSVLDDYAAPRAVGVSAGCDSAQSSDSGISSVSSSCSSSSSREAAGKKFFEDATDGGGVHAVPPFQTFDVEYGTMNDYDIPMPHYTATAAVDASQPTSSMPRRPCPMKAETPVAVVIVPQSSCAKSTSNDGDYDELPSIIDVSHQMDYRPIQNYINQDYRRQQQQLQQQQQQQQQQQLKQMQLTSERCQLGLLRDNVIRSVGRFLGWTTALTSAATDSHSPTGESAAASTSRQWFGQVKMSGLAVKTSIHELVVQLLTRCGSGDVDETLRQNVDQLRSRLADIEHQLESVFATGRTSTLRGRTDGCSSMAEPPDAAKIDAVRRLAAMMSDLPRLVQQIVDFAAGMTLPSSLLVGKSNSSGSAADVQLSNGPQTSAPPGYPAANGGCSPPERQHKSSICSSHALMMEPTVRGKPPPVKPKPPKSVTWKKPEVRNRTPEPPSIPDTEDFVDGCNNNNNNEMQNNPKTKTQNGEKTSTAYGEGWTDDSCDYVSIVRQVEREMAATVAPAVPRRTASVDAARLPPIAPPRQHRPPTAVTPPTPVPPPMNDSDRELVAFYAAQIDSHSAVLAAASAEFYRCMTSSVTSSSPDVFVRRSRLVVLAAHKLVYVGDAIARHVTDQVVCDRVASAANALCDRLKAVVMATKYAALADVARASERRCAMVDCIQRATDCARRLGDVIYSCTSG